MVGSIVVSCIPAGVAFIGIGASKHASKARAWYVVGAWVIGVGVMVLFIYTVLWPFVRWAVGPFRDRFMKAGIEPAFRVVDASYEGLNVTASLNRLVMNGRLDLSVLPESIGVDDPAPGVVKRLEVKYRYEGSEHFASSRDGETLALPPP